MRKVFSFILSVVLFAMLPIAGFAETDNFNYGPATSEEIVAHYNGLTDEQKVALNDKQDWVKQKICRAIHQVPSYMTLENLNPDTRAAEAFGDGYTDVRYNYGTITNLGGYLGENHGTITNVQGKVYDNYGTISNVIYTGAVSTNKKGAVINSNFSTITTNLGTVEKNYGTVYNLSHSGGAGLVNNNYSVVYLSDLTQNQVNRNYGRVYGSSGLLTSYNYNNTISNQYYYLTDNLPEGILININSGVTNQFGYEYTGYYGQRTENLYASVNGFTFTLSGDGADRIYDKTGALTGPEYVLYPSFTTSDASDIFPVTFNALSLHMHEATGSGDCERTIKCGVCNKEYKVYGEHNIGSSSVTVIPATCTDNEKHTGTCSKCFKEVTVEVAGTAKGHSFTQYVPDGNATCTEDGTKLHHVTTDAVRKIQ